MKLHRWTLLQIAMILSNNLLFSFYLMVVAYQSYADGNLQFFGNIQSVELDGECTGHGCQTGGGVVTTQGPGPGSTFPPVGSCSRTGGNSFSIVIKQTTT